MTRPAAKPLTVLCSAIDLVEGAAAPDWVELLPAGDIRTIDGRGPYKVKSMAALATALNDAGRKLPIDECHATDRAQPQGQPAPARAWLTSFEERDGALWGKADWSETGLQLMAEKAYIGLSPVITHLKDGTIVSVLRASLTNTPNLSGLTALHSEEDQTMDWKAKLIELLGLDGNADDSAIDAALSAKMTPAKAECSETLANPAVVALQSELSEVSGKFTALQDAIAKDKAEAFVDAAIVQGRVGVKPLRDEYVAMHMADPAKAAKMIGAQPILSGTTIAADLAPADGQTNLDQTDRQVMALFGINDEDYAAGLAARGQKKDAL